MPVQDIIEAAVSDIVQRNGNALAVGKTVVIGDPSSDAVWATEGNRELYTSVYVHEVADEDTSEPSIVLRGKLSKKDILYGRVVVIKQNKFDNWYIDSVETEADATYAVGIEQLTTNDPVFLRQLVEIATAHPIAGSLSLEITEGLFSDGRFPGTTSDDFSSEMVQDTSAANITIPTTNAQAKGVLVQIDVPNLTLEYKQSSEFPAILSLPQAYSAGLLPEVDTDRWRCCYFKLVKGIAEFTYDHIWNTPEILSKSGSGILNNLTATTDPDAPNDNTEGYSIGSIWINTVADSAWIAVDVSTMNAYWQPIGTDIFWSINDASPDQFATLMGNGFGYDAIKNNQTTTDPTVSDDNTEGYSISSRWINTTNDTEFLCTDASTGAAVWVETTASGGSFTSFDLAADSGTPETVDDSETVTIAGGTGIDTVVSATNTVTVAIDSTVATLTGSQSLTNKNLTDASNTFAIDGSEITSGTIAHERGGLEADVSAYNGLVKISGGATSAVTAPTGTIVGTSDAQTLFNKSISDLKLENYTELTISSGAVTATQSYHVIDTESDAASDDLDTISGGGQGDLLWIAPDNDVRTIVLKHGTGNIYTFDGSDITLDDSTKYVHLIHNGSAWLAVGTYGSSGGSSAGTDYTGQYLTSGTINTTSSTYADIDGTNIKETVTLAGGETVDMVLYIPLVIQITGGTGSFKLVAGTTDADELHEVTNISTSTNRSIMLFGRWTGLGAGTFDFKPQFKTSANTCRVSGDNPIVWRVHVW